MPQVTLGEALEGTGFDPARPSFFCVEGLIYYLPRVGGGLLGGVCVCVWQVRVSGEARVIEGGGLRTLSLPAPVVSYWGGREAARGIKKQQI